MVFMSRMYMYICLYLSSPCCMYRFMFLKDKWGKSIDSFDDICLTEKLSGLNLPLHLHPLQAANCCRNSRLVVDEDDWM